MFKRDEQCCRKFDLLWWSNEIHLIFHLRNIWFIYRFNNNFEINNKNINPKYQNYKRLKGIKEWGFGLFEGESIELLKTIKEPENLYGDHVVPFGGESKSEVESRVFETLEDVIVNQTNQTALAVSHGSTIGLFIRKVLGKREGSTYDIGNCHILKFEYDGNHFRFIEIINPSV